MFRSVIPAALMLAAALTGCGGGGGGSGTVTPQVVNGVTITAGFISTPSSFIPSLVSGKFDGVNQYVVLSGWYRQDLTPPPVKVYKLNQDGTAADATVAVLGSEHSISVNYPLVADFNHDGIDDIFFPGFTDDPGTPNNPSYAFISRAGQSHQRVAVPGLAASHGSTVVDINGDGHVDVINSQGHMWLNDGTGQFSFRQGLNWQNGYPDSIGGSSVCAGDFDQSGTAQVVAIDLYLNGTLPIQDSYIFKFDANLGPVKQAVLPMPWFDRANTGIEDSHDVSCVVGDVNNDGWQDVIVVSAKMQTTTPQSVVQIYLNRGNWQFDDVTTTAMMGWSTDVLSSYTPKLHDFNGDGKLDIWLMDWDNWGRNSNQLWLNSTAVSFTKTKQTDLDRLLLDFRTATNSSANTMGIMLPVKINGKWNFAFTASTYNKIYIGYANTQWVF